LKSDLLINQLVETSSEIIAVSELSARLQKNRALNIKLGLDPTAPDIHLGHTIVLNQLKLLQDAGHTVFCLIGDFTAQIGDPTGKNITRKPISVEQILDNAKTYESQVFKILDPDKTKIVFNSAWLNQLTPVEFIKLASQSTVAQMLERDDFSKRYQAQTPIGLHEFLYPLLQGYDSVYLKSDIELGGMDQKFNLLLARELQRAAGQDPQIVITESPDSMFGKIMSISDELMWRYYELLSNLSKSEQDHLKKQAQQGKNPRDLKMDLARLIITRYHDLKSAEQAQAEFIARFQRHEIPTDISEITVQLTAEQKVTGIPVGVLLKQVGLVESTSQAIRLIQQRAVRIDQEVLSDPKFMCVASVNQGYLFQVGKRKWMRVWVENIKFN
jgi:tyrosyl-tRNA synthetase